MELEDRLRLSYYREIASISPSHGVLLAQHTETGKIFVLKHLRVYDRRVYDYLRTVCPSGVPHIYDLIEADGTLCVVEEYISGKSLREVLDEKGSFTETEAIGIIDQVCNILQPFHQQAPPIVHRDIKPENIFLDEHGQLFLVDFNAAKECDSDKSRDTVLFGTAGYAAPEQYGFGASTPAADIYSLGVLLRVLLTGDSEQQNTISKNTEAVIKRCTHLDPSDRYRTMEELRKALPGIRKESTVRSWLPPGIRNRKPTIVVLSSLWYFLIILLSAALVVENATTYELWVNRASCFILFLSETLWIGNYRNVWSYLPLSASKNRTLRILGIILWAFVLFCIVMALCVALE